jgi:RNA polymerase sigma-70 factor (ECF subfamily)
VSTLDLDVHLPSVAGGDARAYGAFLACAEPVVRRSLRSFATRVDVEAVLQEAFLRLWQVAPRVELDGRPNSFLRLGLRIARNLALDECKRRRELPLPEDFEPAADPVLPDPMIAERIRVCFGELPPKPGAALRARLDGDPGEPDAAIAARIGMRVNTFFQNVTRARKALLECLARTGVVLETARKEEAAR